MAESEQYVEVCRDHFKSIEAALQKIDKTIRGNGAPGVYTRLDRLERAELTRNKLLWLIAAAVTVSTVALLYRFLVPV